jgi:hypothetical protein
MKKQSNGKLPKVKKNLAFKCQYCSKIFNINKSTARKENNFCKVECENDYFKKFNS